jgi:hypothetical protein
MQKSTLMHNLCFQFLVLKIEAIHEEFQTCKNCIINSQIIYGFINDFSAKKTISSPSVMYHMMSTLITLPEPLSI